METKEDNNKSVDNAVMGWCMKDIKMINDISEATGESKEAIIELMKRDSLDAIISSFSDAVINISIMTSLLRELIDKLNK